jgi:SPASM domain peptide maturase of grasp-with-spasm system
MTYSDKLYHDKSWKLFACCIPVKGFSRSLLCDVQRNKFIFIPNDLYSILIEDSILTLKEIVDNYGNDNKEVLLSYFEFLLTNELLFFTDNPNLFPNIDLVWQSPHLISNVIKELNNFGCLHLQVRFFEFVEKEKVEHILNLLEKTKIISLSIIIPYSITWTNKEVAESFTQKYPRISELIITNAPQNEKIEEYKNSLQGNMGVIEFLPQQINSSLCCGNISMSRFIKNLPTFTESQHHNTCLNRKISIDVEGNIKNCPSMAQSFGNIRDTTLQEALEHPDFKKYWNVKKDEIAVCKDCEFRHICTDCRAYLENPEDMYSKPLKCGYNPYTAEWEEWSTNPLKEKAIAYYGMKELVKA